jgi:hypothetical protein
MKTLTAYLMASLVLLASTYSQADTIEVIQPQDKLEKQFSDGVAGGMQAGLEFGTTFPRFLVGVEYRGVEGHIKGHEMRYFWVSGTLTYQNHEGVTPGHPENAPTLDVEIIPATLLEGSNAVRLLPIEVRRELDFGVNASVSARVIGFAKEAQIGTALQGADAATAFRRLTAFARVAVDVLGFRAMSLDDIGGGPGYSGFTGLELAHVKFQTGAQWNMSKGTALRISVGGSVMPSIGKVDGKSANVIEGDFFARLEFLFKLAANQWSLFTQAGQRFVYDSADGQGLQTQGYVQIGLRAEF